MGGACGTPHILGIYLISNMHTKTIQKIQKAYIKTYEEDVKIYKDIENSQGQGAFFFFENIGMVPPCFCCVMLPRRFVGIVKDLQEF